MSGVLAGLLATVLDYADPVAVVAAARGVIRGELMRRCHLSKSTAGEIATAITSEVVDALVKNFCASANALTMN